MHKVVLKKTKYGNTYQMFDKFSIWVFKIPSICLSMIELLLASVLVMGK